ncbi:MAG: T9SS type A sorting domain-containing protein, partial [Chitinophagales bacterium]|nr:T9SS type A sorting domain-containing protein [Chitinophagales bacterium]
FIAAQKSADGQIVYHDVAPDDTLSIIGNSGEWYSLDLNNDGIADYSVAADIIYFENHAMIGKYANGSISNSVAGTYANVGMPAYNVFKLEASDPISQSVNWVKANTPKDDYFGNLLEMFSYEGYWQNGVTDGYIGLRIHVGINNFYGWLRCDVAADASFIIIKDYAYNSIPDSSILAGQGIATNSNEISESEKDFSLHLFPNPTKDILTLTTKEHLINSVITVYDLAGRIIKQEAGVTLNSNAVYSLDIGLLNAGSYLLEVRSSQNSVIKKFNVVQ